VLKDFYAFHEDSKLSAVKYENLAEDPNAALTRLTPGNNKRASFALGCWRSEHIILAGGFKDIAFGQGGHLRSVLSYQISTDKWTSKPDMSKTRNFAAMSILKDKAFVFGGFKSFDNARREIEVLDLVAERARWELMTAVLPTPRANLAVGPINDREIAILGGKSDMDNSYRDVLILNTVDQSIRVAIEDIGFEYEVRS